MGQQASQQRAVSKWQAERWSFVIGHWSFVEARIPASKKLGILTNDR
jgi:hypothetical protein